MAADLDWRRVSHVSGLFHFTLHNFLSNFEIALIRDFFNTIGFLFLVLGAVRYSQFQIEYSRKKQEALQRI